jgi:hypothetical protein
VPGTPPEALVTTRMAPQRRRHSRGRTVPCNVFSKQ